MTLQELIAYFVISFGLTLFFSWIGDDDVVYTFLNRKPTLDESLKRARFVLAKFFASITGGGLTALFLAQQVLREILFIDITKLQFIFFMAFCMVLFNFLIGLIQNFIRSLRGRKSRPVFDIALWKNANDQWKRRF